MRIGTRALLFALTVVLAPGLAAGDVLREIVAGGQIRIGYRSDAPPFAYESASGEPRGLAVALCQQVVRSIAELPDMPELQVKFQPVNARNRFTALLKGRTHLHCGPASATLERRRSLDFSILYFVDGAAAVVRRATYDSIFSLKEGRIGVSSGTTTERVVRNLVAENGIDAVVVTFPNHSLGLEALNRERLDAYFGDSGIMRYQIEQKALFDRLELLPETFSFEPYALVMKRGETALRLAVDRALSEIYDSGLIYNLIQDEMGDARLSPMNRAVYQIVGLPG